MRILAFDTSMSACSVAVWDNDHVLAETIDPTVHGQVEKLLPAIEKTMDNCATQYSDFDRIAVTVGPGSFTGVRVGLATARGLGAATGLPVIGIRTTEVMAVQAREQQRQPIAVAVDARRAEVYLHLFQANGEQVEDPVCVLPEEAAARLGDQDWLLVGDAAQVVLQQASRSLPVADIETPHPGALAALVAKRPIPSEGPRPVYVRPPDAVVPQHGGRLRP